MRYHRIVFGVRVLGDVEILLNLSLRIGQKSPMSANAGAVLIGWKRAASPLSQRSAESVNLP